MRRIGVGVLSLVTVLLTTGMGELGGAPNGTVPEPKENIRAHLVDRSGEAVALAKFSMDGNVYLEGIRGNGKVTVLFRELERIDFGPVAGEKVAAQLRLKEGEVVPVRVGKRALFFGHTGYGAYEIRAQDVQEIEFLPPP